MKVTFFTPSYNRAYTLGRLYDSLKVQGSFQDFEWLIVDDGSQDNTRELVGGFIADNILNIRYIYQENQGKSQAHNRGVLEALGEYFVCIDSDDYVTKDALATIVGSMQEMSKEKCVGLVAMKGTDEHTPIQGRFMPDVNFASLAEVYAKGYIGDTTLVFKTSIIRAYLFPKIEGEKYIPEAYIYDQIDDENYKYLVVNKILTICEYLPDGLSASIVKVIVNNPRGFGLWYNQCLKKGGIMQKLKNAIRYNSVMILAREKHYVMKSNNKLLSALMILPGRILARARIRSCSEI